MILLLVSRSSLFLIWGPCETFGPTVRRDCISFFVWDSSLGAEPNMRCYCRKWDMGKGEWWTWDNLVSCFRSLCRSHFLGSLCESPSLPKDASEVPPVCFQSSAPQTLSGHKLPGGLILNVIRLGWDLDSAFPASSQTMLMLLVHGFRFE